jgi:hypothetical protein
MTALDELLAEPRVPELGPGKPVEALRGKIEAAARDLPPACAAGLWLLFDFLDESHTISQDVHTPDGSFWHAIMHRREPDAFNSKYWWRKVGPHPVLDLLVDQAPSLDYAYTTPEAFVDHCERVRGTGSDDEDVARRVQSLEWHLLFAHCRGG